MREAPSSSRSQTGSVQRGHFRFRSWGGRTGVGQPGPEGYRCAENSSVVSLAVCPAPCDTELPGIADPGVAQLSGVWPFPAPLF